MAATSFMQSDAQEILDRLDDLGLGEGIVEADLVDGPITSAFRSMCDKLASAVLAAPESALPLGSRDAVQGAVSAVQQAASGNGASSDLEPALQRLARAVDPSNSARHRLQVVEELVAYVQAGRMLEFATHTAGTAGLDAAEMMDAPGALDQSGRDAAEVSAQLHKLAEVLQVDTAGRSAADILTDISTSAAALLARLPADYDKPLLKRSDLTDEQFAMLSDINDGLKAEHLLRRRMLIERVKVTLKSFMWSKRIRERGTEAEAAEAAARGEAAMTEDPGVSLDDVFTLRQSDLVAAGAKITSGTGGGLRATVKGVLIGAVPDRGGRAEGREAQALANMPAFSARKAGGGGGGRGGGGGKRDGGQGGGGGGRGGGKGGGRDGGKGGGKRHRER